MVKPLLSTKFLRECFDYNPMTGALTWKVRPLHHFKKAADHVMWNKRFAGREAGKSDAGYVSVGINYIHYRAHRIIWKMHTGRWPKSLDHKNRNGLDNRLSNLREATWLQNSWNKARYYTRDLPRGVYRNHRGSRFGARLMVNGKWTQIGSFDTPEEAHAAWCAAVRDERGEFFRAD